MLPLVLAAPAAAAAVATDGPNASVDVVTSAPTHRSGIAVGLSLGAGAGAASGYPNNSEEIGDPQYYSSSGWIFGNRESLFVMGALADYLNFGFWFSTASFRHGDSHASAVGVGVRVEAFPFLTLVPSLDGLGLFAQFGLGTGKLETTGRPDAEGTQSTIGTGAFYEWPVGHFLGGHAGIGPSLEYDAMWSQPFSEHNLVASARVVFYGGP